MSDDKIIDRVRKLLRLSTSDNVHEAANAAAQAQRLMEAHRLTHAQLEEPEDPIGYHKDAPLETARRVPIWKSRLSACLCVANDCECMYVRWRDGGSSLVIVGREEDANVVRYLYAYLVREIDRLTKRQGAGRGRAFATDFRLGCVETIAARLDDAKRRARRAGRAGVRALARLDRRHDDVLAWMRAHLSTSGQLNIQREIGSALGRIRGRMAGGRIDLGGPRAQLGRGSGKLKGE